MAANFDDFSGDGIPQLPDQSPEDDDGGDYNSQPITHSPPSRMHSPQSDKSPISPESDELGQNVALLDGTSDQARGTHEDLSLQPNISESYANGGAAASSSGGPPDVSPQPQDVPPPQDHDMPPQQQYQQNQQNQQHHMQQQQQQQQSKPRTNSGASPFSNFSNRFQSFQQSFKSSFNEFTGVLNDPSNPSYSSVNQNGSNGHSSGSGVQYSSKRVKQVKYADSVRDNSSSSKSGRNRSGSRPPNAPPPSVPHSTRSHTIHAISPSMSTSSSSGNYVSVSQSTRVVGMNGAVKSFFGHHSSSAKRRHSLLHEAKYGQAASAAKANLPSNMHPPESFVNLLYRMIEDFGKKQNNNKHRSSSHSSHHHSNKFALAILDIDNLRGHIQSPLLTQEELKQQQKENAAKLKMHQMNQMKQKAEQNNLSRDSDKDEENEMDNNDDGTESQGMREKLRKKLKKPQKHKKDKKDKTPRPRAADEMEEKDEENDDMNGKENSIVVNGVDAGDAGDAADAADASFDETKELDPAERAGQINLHRRKSSYLLNHDTLDLDYDGYNSESANGTNNNNNNNNLLTASSNSTDELLAMANSDDVKVSEQSSGDYLSVGMDPLDPYVLFWNNSSHQQSVVKVVQDMILMSVSKSINVTHFGFGEFAIVAAIQSENEIARIVKKILSKVSSNAQTRKLGPVTLCAGISIYDRTNFIGVRQWINQSRQACILAKTNGRGRVSFYVTPEKRRNLAVQLMLEIKKPPADFSGARVLELIRQGADLNFQYRNDTVLMVSIKYGNEQATRYITQYDYDPNLQDRDGKTALILALESYGHLKKSQNDDNNNQIFTQNHQNSQNSHKSHKSHKNRSKRKKNLDFLAYDAVLDALVSKRDLNPRIRDNEGNSCLTLALSYGYREIAKTLILLGAEPLLTDKTILMDWFNGARNGSIQLMERMMDDMGFPVDMIDDSDMTALMHACENGKLGLVKILVERGANVNIQGYRGYTALMLACQGGRPDIFDFLASSPVSALVGLIADDGATILMAAAKGDMPEVIKKGVNARVDVNARDINGMTALMHACVYKSDATATELLRNGADLEVCDKDGKNALMIAAENGSSRIVSMLITLGGKINEADDKLGRTALMYAAMSGNVAIVSTIIKYGGDLSRRDYEGSTAIDIANEMGHNNIGEMIEQGNLTDFQGLLEQLEVMRQKNESLQRTIKNLTDMNLSLADDINKTEKQKHQLQNKLNEAMTKLPKIEMSMFRNFTQNFNSSSRNKKKSG